MLDKKDTFNPLSNIGFITLSFSDLCTICYFTDPFILPHQQVDKGAIKFVLSGANIMCPGLTSPGAKLYPADVDTVVVSSELQHRIFY